MSETLDALRKGKTVEVDGCKVKKLSGEIERGDFYVAERNTGPHLLECSFVNEDLDIVVPVSHHSLYELCECVRVDFEE